MRCTAYEYANMSCQLLGLSGIEACSKTSVESLPTVPPRYLNEFKSKSD
jgi:hypothetical protein